MAVTARGPCRSRSGGLIPCDVTPNRYRSGCHGGGRGTKLGATHGVGRGSIHGHASRRSVSPTVDPRLLEYDPLVCQVNDECVDWRFDIGAGCQGVAMWPVHHVRALDVASLLGQLVNGDRPLASLLVLLAGGLRDERAAALALAPRWTVTRVRSRFRYGAVRMLGDGRGGAWLGGAACQPRRPSGCRAGSGDLCDAFGPHRPGVYP